MTMEAQSILRKSLDEVTHIQKTQFVLFGVMFLSVAICILWLGRFSGDRPIDIQKIVVAAMCFALFSMVYVGVANAMFVTRMTKRVLRAIELAAKT